MAFERNAQQDLLPEKYFMEQINKIYTKIEVGYIVLKDSELAIINTHPPNLTANYKIRGYFLDGQQNDRFKFSK